MSSTRVQQTAMIGIGVLALGLAAGIPASADTDTIPPSVPQNLRTVPAFAGDETVRWDASTDNSGSVYHYWVLVDGTQKARPVAPSYDLRTLIQLSRGVLPGTHTVTVLAVDRALNRSGQSNPILVDIH
jgi:hypothetical protein